ncbi:aldehyde dehydrogenase [Sphingobium sp. TKS]|uniref:aldehyde dehydrogenase n=1 Tax=Sphingobium sp. TKS TaxID=1315974 RepID=UPI000AFAA1D3|nr:aldehyde dehydrogenase [Sphingobium sp. TKS]
MADVSARIRDFDHLFINGEWQPSTSGACFDIFDSSTEALFARTALARPEELSRAVQAARDAFDTGPWPRMTHKERAGYLRAIAAKLRERAADLGECWTRETGILHSAALHVGDGVAGMFDYYAGLAESYPFIEPVSPTAGGEYGLIVREPVGVVGAIIPWNGPLGMIGAKVAPALIAGCTIVLKAAPEAPAAPMIVAEIAQMVGLPHGVLNVLVADRDVSEQLVRDPRVDKITFTGSTSAGRRIASLCGERIARCTLELGGKSAAVLLNDADVDHAARHLAASETLLSGQVCSSLTRIIVPRKLQDDFVSALSSAFEQVKVGDPFDPSTGMGPLATERQRSRVEHYIDQGVRDGGRLVTGGGRPRHLDKGWYIEPTIFDSVDNGATIAQEEIFGPVLAVIPADSEEEAVRIANDTIYGLNASVFTADMDRALAVSRALRSGTVGHNAWRSDFGIAFGGFKQSGLGREGGKEGLLPFLETKVVILDGVPGAVEN